MKMTVFWGVPPCSLVEINQRLTVRTALTALMMRAVGSCESSVNFGEVHDAASQKTGIFSLNILLFPK
jgi:hypothetical protein